MKRTYLPKWHDGMVAMLEQHMRAGKSFQSFGGKSLANVNVKTLYCWLKTYPHFRAVKEKYESGKLCA